MINNRKLTALILALWLGNSPSYSQPAEFDADSAFATLAHLTIGIGPRPMGSHNEQAALHWVAERFGNFGADTSYVMPVPRSSTTNTTSGVAVGIFPGRTDSLIVIGGHIDSDFQENPGANDNASGTATVLELARLWSKRDRRFTMVFTAFGGEESGLVGSRWFASHFEAINKTALMLSIDMAGEDGPVTPFFESGSHQAPEWLMHDAFALDRALDLNRLRYSTHFFSWNTVGSGIAGSDHAPFVEQEIPAVTFTSGINTSPIHTSNDRLELLSRSAIEQMGRFVDALLVKYDKHGIPPKRTGNSLWVQEFGNILAISNWYIYGVLFIALLLTIFVWYRSRLVRTQVEPESRARFSTSKILLMTIIVALFAQSGEAALQFIKGLRYPWYVHINEYLILAGIMALLGLWAALRLTKSWRFTPEPHAYLARALVILLVMTLIFLFGSPRLALYPALALLGFSLAAYLPTAFLKLPLVLVAVVPMFRLLFNEHFPLLARTVPRAIMPLHDFVSSLIYTALLTTVLVLWLLPLAYMIAFVIARHRTSLTFLRYLRHPVFALLILLGVFGYGGFISALPAYNERWHASLRLQGKYDLKTRESKLELFGSEYFREVEVFSNSFTRPYDDRLHYDTLPVEFEADWFSTAGTQRVDSLDQELVHLDWLLQSVVPWHQVVVELKSDTLKVSELQSTLCFKQNDKRVTFRWYADPPDSLRLQASLRLPQGARLIRTITGSYAGLPVRVEATAKLTDIMYRTRVTRTDTLTANDFSVSTGFISSIADSSVLQQETHNSDRPAASPDSGKSPSSL